MCIDAGTLSCCVLDRVYYSTIGRGRQTIQVVSMCMNVACPVLQCWRQWQESVEENKGARVALSFFSNITLRKAFNQWLVWAQERQEYGTKLHLAVQVPPLPSPPLPCCWKAAFPGNREFLTENVPTLPATCQTQDPTVL